MTRGDFDTMGGTVTTVHRNPADYRYLAELPHADGTIRRRAESAQVAISECLIELDRRGTT